MRLVRLSSSRPFYLRCCSGRRKFATARKSGTDPGTGRMLHGAHDLVRPGLGWRLHALGASEALGETTGHVDVPTGDQPSSDAGESEASELLATPSSWTEDRPALRDLGGRSAWVKMCR